MRGAVLSDCGLYRYSLTRMVVAAWGNAPRWRQALVPFDGLGVPWQCLGTTQAGAPRHPLYVRDDARLVGWTQ